MITNQLGLFGDIIDAVSNAFGAIGNAITGVIDSVANGLINQIQFFISKIFYCILIFAFQILDLLTAIFRKICGLDSVQIGANAGISQAGTEYKGDLALALIQSQQVQEVFISLLIVAIILLFVFTFIAVFKGQYDSLLGESKKGSIGPIIGKALKALLSFIVVPLCCIFGIFVSNGLLQTIDGATRTSNATTISGEIFSASAYSCNRVRTDNAFADLIVKPEERGVDASGNSFGINPDGIFTTRQVTGTQMSEREMVAYLVDQAFAGQIAVASGTNLNGVFRDGLKHMQNISAVNQISKFDFTYTELVWLYYDLTSFNWLLAFIACFFIGGALLATSIGAIQRLYEIAVLFVISPPFVALTPLDDGKALGGWRKKFIENVLVVYGTIVAINLFFMVVPVLLQINLFYSEADLNAYGATLCGLFNSIAHILFIICGALMIKEISGFISQLIGGADLMKKGMPGMQDIRNTVGTAKGMYDTAKKTAGNIKQGAKQVWNGKDGNGGLKSKIKAAPTAIKNGILKTASATVKAAKGVTGGYYSLKRGAHNKIQSTKQSIKNAGGLKNFMAQEMKQIPKGIAEGAKDAGQKIKESAVDAGKAIKEAAMDAGRTIKDAVVDANNKRKEIRDNSYEQADKKHYGDLAAKQKRAELKASGVKDKATIKIETEKARAKAESKVTNIYNNYNISTAPDKQQTLESELEKLEKKYNT